MRIVVFSDSHGNRVNMRSVLDRQQPGMVFFLGDGCADITAVMGERPQLPYYAVSGNCDLRRSCPKEQIVTVEGVRMLLSHGHEHGVKWGYSGYVNYGVRKGAEVILCGHTHQAVIQRRQGILLLNPGSVGDSFSPSYGVLEMAGGEILGAEICPVHENG